MANEVFISYSRKDFEKVKTVKEEIDRLVGIDCWMDLNGIESGDWFKKVIISAINRHNTLLFMLTPNSMNSQFAMKELGFAASKGKRIILVDLEHTLLNDEFLFDYSDKDNIDWNDPLQHEKLLNNLRTWFPTNPTIEKQSEYPSFFSNLEMPTINVLFLVDCSGSMMGKRMEEVNQACSEVFRDFDIINPDVDIKVDVLMFGTNVRWMSPTPVLIKDFTWTPLESGGLTSFGEACSELNRKMNRKEFFANNNTVKKSLIVLMTDGEPTDDYDKPFQNLQHNPYFKNSNRFAIGIGEDYNEPLLTKFAGAKKVFTLPDYGDGPRLKPLLERIIHIGLYAASYAALDENDS